VVIVAVLASAAAAFFYVRVIVVMYFHEPDSDSAYVAHPSILSAAAIGISVAATIALGVVPGPVLDLAQSAGQFIR
jgi:NADH-quinone oxidoreductase subunit N